MFKKIAVGTAFLAAAMAVVPTAVQAHERYYGNDYSGAYSGNHYYGEERDRYLDHEARERRERFERQRTFREHLRRERLRRLEHLRYRHGYYEEYGDRRGW